MNTNLTQYLYNRNEFFSETSECNLQQNTVYVDEMKRNVNFMKGPYEKSNIFEHR